MVFFDDEFGEVLVRQNPLVRGVKFSISTSGRLQMSVPTGTSEFLCRRFLKRNRSEIKDKLPLNSPNTQRARDAKRKILMKQAREYLPYRLDFWATRFGYKYTRLRLSHANTRWGSCSSLGTISLNIGLMNVPEELRDYVILHELAHLSHLDHSPAFWAEVEKHDKCFRQHRERLRDFSPGV